MLRRLDIKVPEEAEEPLLGLAERLGVMVFSSPCLVTEIQGGEEDIAFTGETVVSFLFSTVEQPADEIHRQVQEWVQREGYADATITILEYPDQTDWMAGFRQYFQPLRVGKGILVCPPWNVPDDQTRLKLLIDPGMAFGTGTHETTRLCLMLLEETAPPGGRFLDLGSGSGILAFYLLRRGAAAVIAVEKEGPAVENLRKNAELNQITTGLEVRCADLSGFSPPWPADGLVANLTSPLLREFLPRFAEWVKPEGWGIFSGVNTANAGLVRSSFEPAGWRLDREITEGEWHGFLARRHPPRPSRAAVPQR
ncbi:MAG: Ribosomal protein L11 methyltransferase [Candidatus Ozemobacter sibiricus]|jgi:ribosomal protein L11 methyltransferase|uniref:Ribosomal protein L11 methyltransferase n=1 Tax=Candidatus Ozemobacter sibiricus TaxID=2268124 RepID=A0A367ZS37_9BACT|nr:MAG: Ribosomal protein L11 methyltransferase [Candidatus Ozemobacter sibiricus]